MIKTQVMKIGNYSYKDVLKKCGYDFKEICLKNIFITTDNPHWTPYDKHIIESHEKFEAIKENGGYLIFCNYTNEADKYDKEKVNALYTAFGVTDAFSICGKKMNVIVVDRSANLKVQNNINKLNAQCEKNLIEQLEYTKKRFKNYIQEPEKQEQQQQLPQLEQPKQLEQSQQQQPNTRARKPGQGLQPKTESQSKDNSLQM